jgi:ferredoxin
MAYKINRDCISCGACEGECPNQAISEDSIYKIDPDKCTECVGSFPTSQCVSACPVDAPKLDEDHKETREQLLAKWAKLHPGEKPR